MSTDTIQINYSRPIKFNSGWNCCKGNETHVVVFDNGTRWAVCRTCAYYYTGPVYTLEEQTRKYAIRVITATNDYYRSSLFAVVTDRHIQRYRELALKASTFNETQWLSVVPWEARFRYLSL